MASAVARKSELLESGGNLWEERIRQLDDLSVLLALKQERKRALEIILGAGMEFQAGHQDGLGQIDATGCEIHVSKYISTDQVTGGAGEARPHLMESFGEQTFFQREWRLDDVGVSSSSIVVFPARWVDAVGQGYTF